MLLSIVTLNYGKSHLTLASLASLFGQFAEEFKENKIELIIVDNASPDDSVAEIIKVLKEKKYPNVHLIANKANDGFGKGCNIGAKHAKGKYILFLNNDTEVKDKGILRMVEYMEKHEEAAFLGGPLSNFDGSSQQSVGTFYSPFKVLLLLTGMQRFGVVDKNPDQITEVEWVKGALLMVRKDVFEKLKGFDENIFMYTEDMELCYRAHLNGYKIFFYPDVKVFHQDQGSSNRTFAIVNIYKNLLYFYKKHRSRSEYIFLKTLLRTKAMTLIGVGRVLRRPYFTQTYEKALKATG